MASTNKNSSLTGNMKQAGNGPSIYSIRARKKSEKKSDFEFFWSPVA